jgi:glucose-6-phosphate dehydrogenase assembly protein OpcA
MMRLGWLRDVLAVPIESIKVEQVDKTEAELLTIKRLLSDSSMERAKYAPSKVGVGVLCEIL